MPDVVPKPLSRQIADKIRDLIYRNVLVSGEKLNELKLCAQLEVSRTPLREALSALNAEGLVQLYPNRGAYVTEVSIEELRHTFEAMSILEGSCARLAAERLTDADLAELERLHGLLEDRYKHRDPHGYVQHNQDYHMFIQEKTGNPVLSKLISRLRGVILLHRYQQIYRPGRLDDSMEEHRRLMEAFRAREGARAERLMQTHLLKQCEALVTHYAELGQSLKKERQSFQDSQMKPQIVDPKKIEK